MLNALAPSMPVPKEASTGRNLWVGNGQVNAGGLLFLDDGANASARSAFKVRRLSPKRLVPDPGMAASITNPHARRTLEQAVLGGARSRTARPPPGPRMAGGRVPAQLAAAAPILTRNLTVADVMARKADAWQGWVAVLADARPSFARWHRTTDVIAARDVDPGRGIDVAAIDHAAAFPFDEQHEVDVLGVVSRASGAKVGMKPFREIHEGVVMDFEAVVRLASIRYRSDVASIPMGPYAGGDRAAPPAGPH